MLLCGTIRGEETQGINQNWASDRLKFLSSLNLTCEKRFRALCGRKGFGPGAQVAVSSARLLSSHEEPVSPCSASSSHGQKHW